MNKYIIILVIIAVVFAVGGLLYAFLSIIFERRHPNSHRTAVSREQSVRYNQYNYNNGRKKTTVHYNQGGSNSTALLLLAGLLGITSGIVIGSTVTRNRREGGQCKCSCKNSRYSHW